IALIRAEVSPEADEGIEFFEKKVRPLLVANCYECHAGSERQGGLRLDSPAQWRQGGDSGPAIVPGRPKESRLLEALHYQNRDLQMPPDGALPAAEVAVIEQWIAMGAPDPRQDPGTPAAAGPGGRELEEGRLHSSMRPLGDYPFPAVRQSDRGW
ncbi:MAG: c-type cytochrome domain-containing protein, partial [Pirellulaceae bacterium]